MSDQPTGAKRYGTGGGDAYYDAVRFGGYEGTREQFGKDQAEFAKNASAVAEAKETVVAAEQHVVQIEETFTNETVPAATEAIENKGTEQVQLVGEKGDEAAQAIVVVGNEQTERVTHEGDTQVARVQEAGSDASDAIDQAKTAAVEDIEQAGETQVGNVNAAGTTNVGDVEIAGTAQVAAVNSAGQTQVDSVNSAGAAQVQAVQQKGEEVLASIPADYTELDQDVDNLKSAIIDITGNEIISVTKDGRYVKVYDNYAIPNDPTYEIDSVNYQYSVIDCTAGDIFTINAKGGSAPRAYIFTKSDGRTTSTNTQWCAPQDATLENYVVTAPADAVKLIINTNITDGINRVSFKGKVMVERVEELEAYITPKLKIPVSAKIAFFGDSIMWGRDGNGSASKQVENTIPKIVSYRTGATCDNLAVGGMGYMRPSDASFDTGKIAYDKIAATDITAYDIIVLCFGANDGFYPVGEWDSLDTDAATSVMGQFNKIVRYIYAQNPGCKIVVFGPWNGRNVGSYPDYWYGDVTDPDAGSQHQGRWSRMTLNNAIARACEYYWIPYIPQFDSPMSPNVLRENSLVPDGGHPVESVYTNLGLWFAGKLSQYI